MYGRLYQYYEDNKEKILYINKLEENGFIIQDKQRYPKLFKYLSNIQKREKETLYNIDVYYQNYLENVYSTTLDETISIDSNFPHLHHPEIYVNVDIVTEEAQNFLNEINSQFSDNPEIPDFVIDDYILSPFFYQYGEISYGDILKIIPNYKINLIDLERCIDEYYRTYIYLSMTTIFNYNRFKNKTLDDLEIMDYRTKLIYSEYVGLLYNTNVKDKIKYLLEKFYLDLKTVLSKITDTYNKIDVEVVHLDVFMDNTFLDVMNYQLYIPVVIDDMIKIYSLNDQIKANYERYTNHLNKWEHILENYITKWEEIYNKWEDTFNYMWIKIYS